ncbi:leader peptidase (prepilin peptidase)/N-methyltransferase [Tamaricihabitans halophyticus]|uniref:Leader peptidase (Prepilin peptidase)/N-methyltransferase n=1 Tax=Tamaricihabitans halophyticus TaxID=1262583 RepID=A0A4R2QCZ7_9PSEU|nr:prepilin peptidase [Tamaricihabitans halophyticus]TCP46274.1 leader peptidase (prepilin peptidase)/N-methyltransferase [Tamaricihabitans halophyticus]
MTELSASLLLGGAGILVGLATRGVLGAIRRGTRTHPLVLPAVTGALWALLGWRFGAGALPGWWFSVPLSVAALAAPLIVADLRHRRLPNVFTAAAYPILGGVLLAAAIGNDDGWLLGRAVLGVLVFGGAHALVHLLAPGALGAGDVKLAGSLGGVLGALGWPALVFAAVLAALCAGLLAVFASSTGRWRGGVPHGPGLLLAVLAVAAFPSAGVIPAHA